MKRMRFSQAMNTEVQMISERIEQLAGDNKFLPVERYRIYIEGIATNAYVYLTKMSEKALNNLADEISEDIYLKFNRSVTITENKIFVSDVYSRAEKEAI